MTEVVGWLILLVLLVVIELATMGLTTIWFAGGALVATIAAACNVPLFLQVALFLSCRWRCSYLQGRSHFVTLTKTA